MELLTKLRSAETYTNPVYDRDFPDPFVLKYCGQYWAYCTGVQADGRAFGVMRSRNLTDWQPLGGAMEVLPGGHTCYWAPEVSYYNGRFYMYYSVGNEDTMQLRVAVAEHPAGPFVDSGHVLTEQPFAIDAHVFTDEDGTRYLFYATDFLEHSHIGTGTVVDRLLDPFQPEGKPRPITRARYDWQVYDPQRVSKGGVRWHTIEGPFVLKRKGRYYQMFSGGNWQNPSYGVSYALSNDLLNPDEWRQVADGELVLPILRTIPGEVVGPGHNSAVRSPDNRELFCVYHRWAADGSGRILALDRQDWAGERMLILGATTTPQPAPNLPAIRNFDDAWQPIAGDWRVTDALSARLGAYQIGERAEVRFATQNPYFLAHLNLRTLPELGETGGYGISLYGAAGALLYFRLEARQAEPELTSSYSGAVLNIPPGEDFNRAVFHLLQLEVNGTQVSFRLDEGKARTFRLPTPPIGFAVITEGGALELSGFEFTPGWEELFYAPGGGELPLAAVTNGWQVDGNWLVTDGELTNTTPEKSRLAKTALFANYQLVINVRLSELTARDGGYGFYPLWQSAENPGAIFRLDKGNDGWRILQNGQLFATLPPAFDPTVHQQFRFRKERGQLTLRWEQHFLGELSGVTQAATAIGLEVEGARAAFEMVRVTALASLTSM
jgi:GH43 family beta-xylosidase